MFYTRRDMHWVDFDKYINPNNKNNSLQQKKRPALIIQNDKGNQFSPTTLVLPITHVVKNMYLPTHVPINKGQFGLKVDSIILAEQVVTINKSDLTQYSYIGRISEEKMNEVDNALEVSVGLQKNKEQKTIIDLDYVQKLIYKINRYQEKYNKYGDIDLKRTMNSYMVSLKVYCDLNNIDKNKILQLRSGEIELKKVSC